MAIEIAKKFQPTYSHKEKLSKRTGNKGPIFLFLFEHCRLPSEFLIILCSTPLMTWILDQIDEFLKNYIQIEINLPFNTFCLENFCYAYNLHTTKMWKSLISLISSLYSIKRRWYNGQHSCLPSSWSGFDSRPTQLFSSAHIYWEKRGSPVVYWSRRLTSVWKFGGSNPVLGECFWANDLNKWSWSHYSRRKLWILKPCPAQ